MSTDKNPEEVIDSIEEELIQQAEDIEDAVAVPGEPDYIRQARQRLLLIQQENMRTAQTKLLSKGLLVPDVILLEARAQLLQAYIFHMIAADEDSEKMMHINFEQQWEESIKQNYEQILNEAARQTLLNPGANGGRLPDLGKFRDQGPSGRRY